LSNGWLGDNFFGDFTEQFIMTYCHQFRRIWRDTALSCRPSSRRFTPAEALLYWPMCPAGECNSAPGVQPHQNEKAFDIAGAFPNGS